MSMMAWFEHSGGRIHYEQEGSGESVLVLPGWAGSIDEFVPIRTALSAQFRVIAADLPGSGRSGPQPRDYTPTYFHDDAETFLALLEDQDAGPAHLVGFSDGGEVALLMATSRPDVVRSVVAWGAAGQLVAPPEMLDAFYHLIDHPIPPLQDFATYLTACYGEENARAMTRSESNALRAIIAAGGDISRSQAASMTCPALLLTGEHDPFCPPALVSGFADEIPLGKFVRVDGVGHDIHTARPTWLANTVANWLESLSSSTHDYPRHHDQVARQSA
jgi:pimeloyl-ACP methyl ester carboxylesterase